MTASVKRLLRVLALSPPSAASAEDRTEHAADDLPSDLAADGMGSAFCHGAEDLGGLGLRLGDAPRSGAGLPFSSASCAPARAFSFS